jgi:O-antigen/teichoic acid export membrane protein
MTTRATDATALVRNTLLNLIGQALPLAVAVVCLPFVVGGLGPERFGVLALCWTVVGYFGAFDLGLGRASTRYVADALARERPDEVRSILGSALAVQGALGAAGGLAIALATPGLVTHVFDLAPAVRQEAQMAFLILALALPIVMTSGSLRGALQAAQRFDLVNMIAVPSSAGNYLLPAIGALAGWTLPTIVALLVATKAAAVVALWRLARAYCPGLAGGRLAFGGHRLRELVRFGSWITVSSAMTPIVNQAERFLIPALLSVGALTFYVVPYEAVSRGAILPASMAMTLFPAFSYLSGRDSPVPTELVSRPLKYLIIVTIPTFTFVAVFARPLLTAWMGRPFAAAATLPLQLLAAAFCIGAFAPILKATIQGLGRADVKAKLDVANAALFLALLVASIPTLGLAGAAAAKLVIRFTNVAGMVLLVSRTGPETLHYRAIFRWLRPAVAASGLFLAAIGVVVMSGGTGGPAYGWFALITVLYLAACWKWSIDGTDRRTIARVGASIGLRRRGVVPSAAEAGK